ncbi:PE-PGRS family protein [Streptomyces adustus]|uniref:PE-PGRS family protein n=1 Tax=Streptomyces adustus TaxID=1609272 RepID=A0A5N8V9I0_9ACTN|nr:PE-PGRS family protein [Streptomyces adustus]MPY30724.1 PE-PGRS family protein [Streptomyces adustus]
MHAPQCLKQLPWSGTERVRPGVHLHAMENIGMRMVNPDDLDQLAKLLDGRGGLGDRIDEAFKRAAALGVADKLTPLRPMRSWVAETAPDLRKRANLAREDQLFVRGHRETYSEWLARIEAHYLAEIPGAKGIGENNIDEFLNGVSDATGVIKIGGTTIVSGAALGNVFLKNSWHQGMLRQGIESPWWRAEGAGALRSRFGTALRNLPAGEIRSLGAPGSWLPGQLGSLFAGNSLYQNVTEIPFTTSWRAGMFGRTWDSFRSLPLVRSPAVTKGIDFIVGSDALAAKYGGLTHSGAWATRAGHTDLFRVFRTVGYLQKLKNSQPAVISAGKIASPFLKGLGAAIRTGGFLRTVSIGEGALSTGISLANVWAQGDPVSAFKEKGAGYVADVTEACFNASLTWAMVSPNPISIGATIGTGLIYGGAKVVEHWDDIKKGSARAARRVGKMMSEAANCLARNVKSNTRAVNPMNWF